MPTLSLCMLVKDEHVELERCFASIAQYVDEIVVVSNKPATKQIKSLIAREPKATLYEREWNKNFADARNFSFSKATGEYIIWLDADDEVKGAENIPILLEMMEGDKIDWIFCNYDYHRSAEGDGLGDHQKPRIIRNDGKSVWQKPIHENLVREEGVQEFTDKIEVFHHLDPDKLMEKQLRNYEYLMAEYEQDGDETDPRTLHYLGQTSLGLGSVSTGQQRIDLLEQAVTFFEKHVQKSGWDEESYMSLLGASRALTLLGKPEGAIKFGLRATMEKPEWCDAYWYLCLTYHELGQFAKAATWGETALTKFPPNTVLTVNSVLHKIIGPAHLVEAYLFTNQIGKALRLAQAVQDGSERMKSLLETVLAAQEAEDYVAAAETLIELTVKYDKQNVSRLVENLPDYIMEDSRIQGLRFTLAKPKRWDNKSVVFFCGRSLEDWSDPSILKGIGGSEEATVYLAREFVKLGYQVTVFNQCGKLKGKYNGVEYRPYWEFNPNDHFNWLIIWRQAGLARGINSAKKMWVWLHDRPYEDWVNEDIIKRVDKFVFLSEYQRKCMPNIPDDKALVSANGLNMEQVKEAVATTPRVSKNVIYASSYDRGLDYLLGVWPEVLKEAPEATLDIYYGWENFDKTRKDPDSQAWKAKVTEAMNQPGVTHHGRVGQEELCRAMAAAEVWAYPTDFWEISCITAMRAQATGATPVCTDFAALNETVQYGLTVSGVNDLGGMSDSVLESFTAALVKALKEPNEEDRQQMMAWAQDYYTWERVAKQWAEVCDS